MTKVYIAGNISNNPNYIMDFAKAYFFLQSKGFIPLSPVKEFGFKYKDYIDMGLAELSKCDAIYLLKGYENSKGAMLEKHYAETVGLEIMYQED